MSIPGCDYSYDPPTPAELEAAGMRFACRYVGTPQSGKNLTLPEAEALTAHGIAIVANYEAGQAGWMQGGRTAGERAARLADADAVRLGMPPTRPIYFSADFNATLDQYKTQIRPCLQGAGSVLGGPPRVGVYGSIYVVTWAMEDGVADWGWQTYAWSYGQWYPKAQLQQWKNGQKLGSGTVDYDRAMVADYGQWKEAIDLTDAEHQILVDIQQRVSRIDEVEAAVAALAPKVADTQKRVQTNDEALSAVYATIRLLGVAVRKLGADIPPEVFAGLSPANAVSAELAAAVTGTDTPPTP